MRKLLRLAVYTDAMNEYIEIEFRKPNGQRLRVKRQVNGGIEFDEPDPIERAVLIQVNGRSEVTRHRMTRIAAVKGWTPGTFQFLPSVEDGNIVLRGIDRDALPEGHYAVRVQVKEAKCRQASTSADVEQDGHALVTVELHRDDRDVSIDLSSCDPRIGRLLDIRMSHGSTPAELLKSDARPARKACLLNILATLCVTPSKTRALIEDVQRVLHVRNDRVYLLVKPELCARINTLVEDPRKPFYAEGEPTAPIHRDLLLFVAPPDAVSPKALRSYRGEGKPSLQMVITPAFASHAYAEFDLDLANPLQDAAGFVFHVAEVAAGKETSHLDLQAKLAKGKAGEFLYYRVKA